VPVCLPACLQVPVCLPACLQVPVCLPACLPTSLRHWALTRLRSGHPLHADRQAHLSTHADPHATPNTNLQHPTVRISPHSHMADLPACPALPGLPAQPPCSACLPAWSTCLETTLFALLRCPNRLPLSLSLSLCLRPPGVPPYRTRENTPVYRSSTSHGDEIPGGDVSQIECVANTTRRSTVSTVPLH